MFAHRAESVSDWDLYLASISAPDPGTQRWRGHCASPQGAPTRAEDRGEETHSRPRRGGQREGRRATPDPERLHLCLKPPLVSPDMSSNQFSPIGLAGSARGTTQRAGRDGRHSLEPRSHGNGAVPTLTLETLQGPDRALLQTKIATIQQGGPALSGSFAPREFPLGQSPGDRTARQSSNADPRGPDLPPGLVASPYMNISQLQKAG